MTLNEFITKYNLKGIDFDGSYGDQCMDLYRQYVKEVLELPQSPGVTGAKDVWDTYLQAHYTRIANGPTLVPKNGDIMIWGKELGNTYGHISVFISGDKNSFKSFDQNWPVNTKCHVQNHNYDHVLGWLHPKKNVIIPPMTCETEKQEIVKLNTEIWKVTFQRDTLSTALKTEVEGHKSTLEQLKTSQAEVTKLEAEMKANQTIIDNVRRDVAV